MLLKYVKRIFFPEQRIYFQEYEQTTFSTEIVKGYFLQNLKNVTKIC